MPTIVQQLEQVQANVAECEHRLDKIERLLRLEELADNERNSLLAEEKVLKKTIAQYDKDMANLRKENRKTMLLSVILFTSVFIGYLYFYGENTIFL
ncbi:coiled-coil domain-containing protein 167-like [Lingula anatina]|uniref:Coiled-coil domain-containing protein 167 n=1 Tax=Lingula anatina TaxID=7574 RepID=A0A1S3J8F7_LINAN|nr:coiled-coil domain-containing protein 167-like [Lingula anatina]|eukprot:XP_013406149.1 coiled-coil domain-containing protein 167-like [Lingula anatina]